ncbi:hypothetical protein AX17_006732 [Amanita inopinata Kibby_2008]|nr:hypothetical protein AX17_006732 [Amanita inopinata Kibby_2008]
MASATDFSRSLNVPLFAGQGTAAINSPETRQQALYDAEVPSCSVLLSACYQTFLAELATLPPSEFDDLDVNLTDFVTAQALLVLQDRRYYFNPVITGPTLFLVQVLRYLAFMEEIGGVTGSLTPFDDMLRCNRKYAVGILGFSSGILPACIVASSTSTINYISHAVEVFRLAIWIGIRTQLYRKKTFSLCSTTIEPSLPWSLVFFGLDCQTAWEALAKFNKESNSPPLYITAVMDTLSVTISGRPDVLATFSGIFGPEILVHETTVDSLYHSPAHKDSTAKQIIADTIRRRISFPDVSNFHTPIRSTLTGNLITKDFTCSLVELVVDLLLTQPVKWDSVMEKAVQAFPEGVQVRLLNIGPGAGLARSIERVYFGSTLTIIDITALNKTRSPPLKKPKQEAIAIVGMAIHMPGAVNTSQLWEVLERGINTISEIPKQRFVVSDYNCPQNVNTKRSMKAHMGNFIDGADEFDNQFFKISPREAKSMDPQQRILLHTAYEALENSGYVPNSSPTSKPERFGCYVGAATHDYLHNLRHDIDVYYSTGTLNAFLSGRLSYAMGLCGPSMVVDTACSSSAVAIYQGSRALMNRDCDAAMVGGVNIISSPDMFLGLDRGHFLSPTGQCKPFDASADGYCRGEGCGMFVLKRLSDAIAENDQIWGVIRGIEVNQSGLAHSITHPHAPTQSALFKQLLENSGIEPHRVNVIEAHGTGTQAGDPVEVESIRHVFCRPREANNSLHITSIKVNIGHLEAASGAAGLAKILLMFQHKTIPRHISFKSLNPRIAPLDVDNTVIDTNNTPWEPPHCGRTRMAVVNNFGASGSNAALAVEEFSRARIPPVPKDMSFVFGLSAKDTKAALSLRDKYVQWLSSSGCRDASLADLAYTATARRQLYESRLAVSASSKDELIKKLKSAEVVQAKERDAAIVFVFSGQGSQYLGMGSSLYASCPLFKRHIDECHAILTSAGFVGVHSIIVPGSVDFDLTDVQEIEAYQAALFSVEYALAKLWLSWGVRPTAVVGHSLGEYAALVTANVLTLHDALIIIAQRARVMVQKCAMNSTGMLAVNLDPERTKDALMVSSSFSDVTIACYNSACDCVVSGPLEQISAFKNYLDSNVHCKNTVLPVPFGYHSPAMEPVLDNITSITSALTIGSPSIPVISGLHGDVVMPGDKTVFDASYFSHHCLQPVQFEKGISSFLSKPEFANVDAWIEVGPHATTLPMLKCNSLIPENTLLLASIRKRDAWSTLTSSLSTLYTCGIRISWRKIFSHIESISCMSLPSYPFAKSKFWVPFHEQDSTTAPKDNKTCIQGAPVSPLLHSFSQIPCPGNGLQAVFETPISQLASYITGHCVGGIPLCPASVYIEQIFAGVQLAMRHLGIDLTGHHIVIREMEFCKPLVYDKSVERDIITTIKVGEASGHFHISSRLRSSEEATHVHGRYRLCSSALTQMKFSSVLPMVDRRATAVLEPQHGKEPEVFSTRTAYDIIFPRVVSYSRNYQTMKSLVVGFDATEGYANVKLPSDYDRGTFTVHPIFMDTLLHVAGFTANLQGSRDDAYICSEVASVKVIPELVDNEAPYSVYCSTAWIPEQNAITADAYALTVTEPRRIVAYLKGMRFQRTHIRSFTRSLSMATGSITNSSPAKSGKVKLSLNTNVCATGLSRHSPTLTPSITGVLASVIAIVADACGIDEQDMNTSLDADLGFFGVDSLMSIEILNKLTTAFPDANLGSDVLVYGRTIEQLANEVYSRLCQRTDTLSANSSTAVTPSVSGPSSPRTLVFDDQQLSDHTLLAIEEDPSVKQIIASVLDMSIHDIDDDQDLQSLGLDSLSSIEALHALKDRFCLDLPSNLFVICKTPRALQQYVDNHARSNRKSNETEYSDLTPPLAKATSQSHLDANPILLQSTTSCSNRLPLFLIHDGSGLVSYYSRLGSLDRSVWGIRNPHFGTAEPWGGGLGQMAKDYADRIQKLALQGSVILGGWSFGGVAAYETCLELQRRGVKVKGVVLIDAPDPYDHVPLSDSLIRSIIDPNPKPPLEHGHDRKGCELKRLVHAQFTMNTRLLAEYKPQPVSSSSSTGTESNGFLAPSIVYLRSKQGFEAAGLQLGHAEPVPEWLSDRSDPERATRGWKRLCDSSDGGSCQSEVPVKMWDIDGNHFNPFHPYNVGNVSLRLAQALEYLEQL